MKEKILLAVVVAAFIMISFSCTKALRMHGVESCENRGGTAITNSWLSENAYDVRCIEGK